jgi:hypothetical protein
VHPLSPALLIAAASASAAVQDDPTGIQFVNHCGHRSHLTLATRRSSWPLPLLPTCDALAMYARAVGILEDDPTEGDIYLKFNPFLRTFVRAGIIVSIDYEYTWEGRSVYLCTVVDAGVSRGCALSPITGDRVVRWVDLEWRRHAA